jgi:hypothetical protein
MSESHSSYQYQMTIRNQSTYGKDVCFRDNYQLLCSDYQGAALTLSHSKTKPKMAVDNIPKREPKAGSYSGSGLTRVTSCGLLLSKVSSYNLKGFAGVSVGIISALPMYMELEERV